MHWQQWVTVIAFVLGFLFQASEFATANSSDGGRRLGAVWAMIAIVAFQYILYSGGWYGY